MFELTHQPIDPAEWRQRFAGGEGGGLVCFEGWVRRSNRDREVLRLEYEAYRELAGQVGAQILDEARQRFGLIQAICVHRVGMLAVGDLAIWAGVLAAHRGEAFAGCRYVVDEVKSRVPIWKKEHYAIGAAEWILPPGVSGGREPGLGEIL